MKHLERFTKWFSRLNTKHKLAIIRKLEEIYEVEAFPELQMKIVSLEAKIESLELTILKLNKELEDSYSRVNKLQNAIDRYDSGKKYSLIDFNHIWSKLNVGQREEMKKAVIDNHWYKEIRGQKEALESQVKMLKEANESLLQQLLELKK